MSHATVEVSPAAPLTVDDVPAVRPATWAAPDGVPPGAWTVRKVRLAAVTAVVVA
jgi:hypothetical protein